MADRNRAADDARPCHCCQGAGWHQSECGGQHFCQACDGTGGTAPVIDMGYLSLPDEVQADLETGTLCRDNGPEGDGDG